MWYFFNKTPIFLIEFVWKQQLSSFFYRMSISITKKVVPLHRQKKNKKILTNSNCDNSTID